MTCECVNVTIGGYENQVVVEAPAKVVAYRRKVNPYLGPRIALDRCVAEEVQALWKQGIVTNGCCCGHNLGTISPYIGVRAQDVWLMRALGYEHLTAAECSFPEYHFKPKSIG